MTSPDRAAEIRDRLKHWKLSEGGDYAVNAHGPADLAWLLAERDTLLADYEELSVERDRLVALLVEDAVADIAKRDATIAQLRAERDTLRAENEGLMADIASLTDDVEAVRGENLTLNGKWAEAHAENQALLADPEWVTVEKLRAEVSGLSGELAEARTTIAEAHELTHPDIPQHDDCPACRARKPERNSLDDEMLATAWDEGAKQSVAWMLQGSTGSIANPYRAGSPAREDQK